MNTIVTIDPYESFYAAAKQIDPDAQIVLRQYQRRIVERIDHIVELAHGQRDSIASERDWKIFEELFIFFAEEWPAEYAEFKSSIPDIRTSRNDKGYSKSREMKYVGAIPPRLMRLTKAIFPSQQWDKKFVNKLVKRFPLFKVG